ncbi:putative cytochrome P450 [Lupinus albus]|uniref:Putative cytochrome P450 n=1 Tax=Lupinus albus TaxID=3870 RepID=A0A6A4PVX1_LUPAL|nr:putative cytochrome P450 [Lupinus albus]
MCIHYRYGNIFKTHALGSPMIVCMDPQINRYMLINESKIGLVLAHPDSIKNIIGVNMAEVNGTVHKRIRGTLLSLIGPAAHRDGLLQKMDRCMRSFIHNWAGKTIDIQQKVRKLAFMGSLEQIVENEPSSFYETFEDLFVKMSLGTMSLPIKIPGTTYYQGLKARIKLNALLEELLAKRKASSVTHDDFLDQLIRNNGYNSSEEIIEQIVTILYAGYDSVSSTAMMTVKYLHDNPRALQAIREEHFALQQNKRPEELINWDDYKKMSFTRAVIFETLRLANVVNGLSRRTTSDLELNGFIIPKGWKIYLYKRETNLDPFLYQEPLTFNPWRWLVSSSILNLILLCIKNLLLINEDKYIEMQEKGSESNSYNLLYGAGGRECPGKELSISRFSLFLHHFVTKYRWEEVEGNKLLLYPRVIAPKGLHIRVSEY